MSTPTSPPRRAVVYVRQSRDDAGTGAAVARQEEACRALALARGWEVEAIFSDNHVSATSGKERPAWRQLLQSVERGDVDVILAWRLDRVTRSILDLEELVKLSITEGVGVVTAEGDIDLTTDSGKMVGRILAAVAAGEVERKSERQRLANQQRVSQGRRRWSHRPFGFLKETGEHHPTEADALREAYRRIARGQRLAEVRDYLHSLDLSTTAGNPWSVQSLRNLILDPRNKGIIRYQGKEAGAGDWEPIVTDDEWANAVAVLRAKRTNKPRATPSDALLVTVAKCGGCGGRVFTEQRKTSEHRSYTCQKGCIHLPQQWVDGRVFLALADFLSDPDQAEQWRGSVARDTRELQEARAKHSALRDRLTVMGQDYADGLLERETMLSATTQLREQIATIEADLLRLEAESGINGAIDVEYLAEQLETAPIGESRESVRRLTDSIVLHRRGKGSREGLSDRLVEVTFRTGNDAATEGETA
ncbi:recombinase family protein [Ornithinimicrobium sp. LYQ121]|uniref:recombinase family protein n=1 Tax=Ornithinimicrobium sp. LYQ121 TaxID=3378801 RepID=UPI0038555667